MRQVIKLISIITLLSISTYLGKAQQLWYSSPRQDYKAVFAAIREQKSVKLMHIGDSHINRGHTSRPIEDALKRKYGNQLDFSYYGINGSTYSSWTNDANLARIKEENPDLLIISLGTNDSYTHNFSAETLRASMEYFIRRVQGLLPSAKIVLTTPPACYLRQTRSRVVGYKKVKRRRVPIYSSTTSYSYNPNTRTAVNTIKYIGQAMGLGVIDLNAYIGTKEQCQEWLDKGWMHSDHVHFTESGYTKHGELIARALLQAVETK